MKNSQSSVQWSLIITVTAIVGGIFYLGGSYIRGLENLGLGILVLGPILIVVDVLTFIGALAIVAWRAKQRKLFHVFLIVLLIPTIIGMIGLLLFN